MEKFKDISQNSSKNNLIRILKGTGLAFIITFIFLLLYSCLLTYTNIKENTMPIVIIIVTALSILIGSFISSMNIKKNGLTNGVLVGLFYILTIYLISSIISRDFGFTVISAIMIGMSILTGAIGGILGVNR